MTSDPGYLLEVVKKLSMVVTPSVTRAGSAFHSIQKVTKEEVTRIIPAVGQKWDIDT